MTSYMIGSSLKCLTSKYGSEATVLTPGGTGAGLMGPPGATPTGALATPMAKTRAKCVSTCIQMEMGQGSEMMDTVHPKFTKNGSNISRLFEMNLVNE